MIVVDFVVERVGARNVEVGTFVFCFEHAAGDFVSGQAIMYDDGGSFPVQV